LGWSFFAQTTLTAARQLTAGGHLIRRIYLPRTVFAVAATGTGILNLLLALIPLVGIMLVTGVPVRLTILFLPVSIAIFAAFTLGVGLALSALAVDFNDATELFSIILPALLYLTPIIYPKEILPASARPWLVEANPLNHLVGLLRTPLCDGRLPDGASCLIAFGTAAAALLIGWLVFTARADGLASRL
jgi:ABC-type polysaccharide/polyol phosphate export permease